MTIEVTQRDIDRGQVGSARLCPVALAIKRKLRRVILVNVHGSWGFAQEGWKNRKTLPPEAANFASRFDDRKPVKPFSFEINPAEPKTGSR